MQVIRLPSSSHRISHSTTQQLANMQNIEVVYSGREVTI
jgi:hypothetical protein